jgi:hypothetical protein
MERDLAGAPEEERGFDRDLADDATGALRDAAPDILAPIDASSPVSGHVIAREASHSVTEAPEHDWQAASEILYPLLRPAGTQGLAVTEIDEAALAADTSRSHSQPIVDEGPCGLVVVYAMHSAGFDVIVNGDHLLSWGVPVGDVQEAALRNLAAWSAGAAWTDEVSGERRLLSSDTGEGWDAARILLPDVLDRLWNELREAGRVLIGVPERHLLIAGALRPDDEEFANLFSEFVVEQSGGADEPVDRRVFELVDGRLTEFAAAAAPA